MSFTEKDAVLTTEEAIEYFKISKPTFLKYIRLGRIKAIKAGKGWEDPPIRTLSVLKAHFLYVQLASYKIVAIFWKTQIARNVLD
jgi:excisionase family DNA binding protein